ncbi:ferritin-like domain-containing protein [Cellulomonas sp. 73-92]|uniref:Dps family protein n=1 Tax=Cellulomonas sp. 73-92 TaxID=1895740 RepID=UPI000B0CE3B5|nr:ferritin-like domain-containing protein [Cellulomonas sp. 73-92]
MSTPPTVRGGYPGGGSTPLVGHLQQLLVDLTELHSQLTQLHRNVVGAGSRSVDLRLDEVADDARRLADEVADRLRAVGGAPDARSSTVAGDTTVPGVPSGRISARDALAYGAGALGAAAATARRTSAVAHRDDPSSADLVHRIVVDLERHARVLAAGTA